MDEHKLEGFGHNSPLAKQGRIQILAQWVATPPAARNPATQRELADQLGVSEATLSSYKREPSFLRLVQQETRQAFGGGRLSAVIDALYRIATEGSSESASVQASKALLAWLENQNDSEPIELATLTDEELDSLAVRASQGESSSA